MLTKSARNHRLRRSLVLPNFVSWSN